MIKVTVTMFSVSETNTAKRTISGTAKNVSDRPAAENLAKRMFIQTEYATLKALRLIPAAALKTISGMALNA